MKKLKISHFKGNTRAALFLVNAIKNSTNTKDILSMANFLSKII